MKHYEISWRKAEHLTEEELEECTKLFSSHYGKWGAAANKQLIGQPVKRNAVQLKEYLKAPESWAALAHSGAELIGYAFSQRLEIQDKGYVTWVTQFVVHSDHRNRGLGTRLLRAIWSQSDQYAWGLVTANPFAVRALENATLRRCERERIKKGWPELHAVAEPFLNYVRGTSIDPSSVSTAINTSFPLDHQDTNDALSKLEKSGIKWCLGNIRETEEWAAFTFSDQEYSEDATILFEKWILDCDSTVRDAYNGMSLSNNHRWVQSSSHEIDVFRSEACPEGNDLILDVGCGTGRHSIELARHGYSVVGIDFVRRLIEEARGNAKTQGVSNKTKFFCEDVREYQFEYKFDHAICLYDVIGSFASNCENRKIIENIFHHLKPGGILLASMMNGELTDFKAIHRANSRNLFDKLLGLKPSKIMQETGNIFDPDYYVWDEDYGVAYRKEQFQGDTIAPCELIVRDRRYSRNSISDLFKNVGFEILNLRFVKLNDWNRDLGPSDDKAKEMLLVCKKPD
jgi:2-polyprenyl-3-methyl-5-hydroxy-6-metoxy-1,4-benzoquinol methylase/GNAT superfamily N-acetyltransferase